MTPMVLIIGESVPLWQSLLTVGSLIGLVSGVVTIQLWSQRRRRRGEEASTYNAEGAEALLSEHAHHW
jgi:hypothetical protein